MSVSGLSLDNVRAYCFSYFWRSLKCGSGWSSDAQTHSQAFNMETWISAGLSTSGSCRRRNSISCRISTSQIAAEFRPPLVCDLKTTEVVGSKRLTSPEWVTTAVGPDTRVASAEADSHGRVLLLRPWEFTGAVYVILSDILALHKQLETAISTATVSARVSNRWYYFLV